MKPLTVALIAGGAALVLIAARRRQASPAPGPLERIGDATYRVWNGIFDFAEHSLDYVRWGDLSAVRSRDGRIVSTVPISETLGPWESYWNTRGWDLQSDGRTFVGAPY